MSTICKTITFLLLDYLYSLFTAFPFNIYENIKYSKNIKNIQKTLAKSEMMCYYIFRYLGVAQLVARLTGGQEAGSSSLLTQTNKADNSFELPALFFYFHYKRRLELLSAKPNIIGLASLRA